MAHFYFSFNFPFWIFGTWNEQRCAMLVKVLNAFTIYRRQKTSIRRRDIFTGFGHNVNKAKNDLFWIEMNEAHRIIYIVWVKLKLVDGGLTQRLEYTYVCASRSNKKRRSKKEQQQKKKGNSVVWQSCINAFLSMIYWLIVADCWKAKDWTLNIFHFAFSFLTLNIKSFIYNFKEKSKFITLQSHCIIINSASIKTNRLCIKCPPLVCHTSRMPL